MPRGEMCFVILPTNLSPGGFSICQTSRSRTFSLTMATTWYVCCPSSCYAVVARCACCAGWRRVPCPSLRITEWRISGWETTEGTTTALTTPRFPPRATSSGSSRGMRWRNTTSLPCFNTRSPPPDRSAWLHTLGTGASLHLGCGQRIAGVEVMVSSTLFSPSLVVLLLLSLLFPLCSYEMNTIWLMRWQ